MAGKIITIGNFKGGVGKTLISYLLYKHFSDIYELMQSDLDAINNNILHITDIEDFKSKGNKIKEILQKKDLLIDTGGFLDNLQTYFFKKSNLIIVPIFLDNINIKRTFLFLKYLKYLQNENINLKNVLVVINKYNKKQEKIKDEFMEYVKATYNINNFFILNDYKSYVKVLNDDINLIKEHNKNKILYKEAVIQIKELNQKIKELL